MKPIKKQFQNTDSFPFKINYRDTKGTGNELPSHVQEWHEIVYVHHGSGTFFIDQQFYEMRPGEVFIIPANTIHRAIPEPTDLVTSTAIFFAPMLAHAGTFEDSFSLEHCFARCRKERNYSLQLPSSSQIELDKRIQAIHQEMLLQHRGFRHAIVLYLQQILLDLSRQVVAKHQVEYSGPAWLTKALHQIEKQLAEDIGLASLSKEAAVSPAHFSRVFKHWTGMNVTEYIATKRILLAKKLLQATDSNVSEIAEQCGFDSMPYFHRSFKKMTGMTPSQYRQRKIASPSS